MEEELAMTTTEQLSKVLKEHKEVLALQEDCQGYKVEEQQIMYLTQEGAGWQDMEEI